MIYEGLEVEVKDGSGTLIERLRRSGAIPDLYTTEDGEIFRITRMPTTRNGSIRYGNTSLSGRILVADAWLPGWEEDHTTLKVIDGDLTNLSVQNLKPSKGGRGRPAGSQIRKQAQVYQLVVSIVAAGNNNLKEAMKLVANELKLSPLTVQAAVLQFEPAIKELL